MRAMVKKVTAVFVVSAAAYSPAAFCDTTSFQP